MTYLFYRVYRNGHDPTSYHISREDIIHYFIVKVSMEIFTFLRPNHIDTWSTIS